MPQQSLLLACIRSKWLHQKRSLLHHRPSGTYSISFVVLLMFPSPVTDLVPLHSFRMSQQDYHDHQDLGSARVYPFAGLQRDLDSAKQHVKHKDSSVMQPPGPLRTRGDEGFFATLLVAWPCLPSLTAKESRANKTATFTTSCDQAVARCKDLLTWQ